MKERPIIMSAESILALLDDEHPKTQTRRVIERLRGFGPITELGPSDLHLPGYDWTFHDREMRWINIRHAMLMERCPYGKVGDRLYVKETWAAVWPDLDPVPMEQCRIEYRADLPAGCTDYPGQWPAEEARGNPDAPKWRSPRFMPRFASRFLLEITSLRAERVQSISHEDAIAEGMLNAGDFNALTAEAGGVRRRVYHDSQGRRCTIFGAKAEFADAWDHLNARRGHPWEASDLVWVIGFRDVTQEAR